MEIHVVRTGETLSSISAFYGVDPDRLAADNAVQDGQLAVGQTLVVRIPTRTYTVQPGETLSSISRAYGLTPRQLWRRNWPLGGSDLLRPGQVLVVSYQDSPIASAVCNGYAYPFIDPALLDRQLPYLSAFTPFTYGIASDGSLLPLQDDAMLSAARAHGVKTVLHLSTLTEDDHFSTERARQVLTDDAMQTKLIDDLMQSVLLRGYAGLDVDFEYLSADLAAHYAAFLARLRRRLQPSGRFLWTALAPKTSADQPGLLYEGHDYRAVGSAADGILLMTYEWGYTFGPPMAVSPLPNVRAVLEYALTEISPEKLLLGISNYGYDWPLPFVKGVTRAQSISNQYAIRLAMQNGIAIQYDETAQSPFFHYTDGSGTVHEVWFEDARSLSAKLHLIAEYGLQGAGIWNLMRPFPQIWQLFDALFQIAP